MSDLPPAPPERSYGCTFGCGRPYDYIFISCVDGTTEFLCLLDFLVLTSRIIEAVGNPESPDVAYALANAGTATLASVSEQTAKAGRHNAPVTVDDPDLITAYEDLVMEEELPDAFK